MCMGVEGVFSLPGDPPGAKRADTLGTFRPHSKVRIARSALMLDRNSDDKFRTLADFRNTI